MSTMFKKKLRAEFTVQKLGLTRASEGFFGGLWNELNDTYQKSSEDHKHLDL